MNSLFSTSIETDGASTSLSYDVVSSSTLSAPLYDVFSVSIPRLLRPFTNKTGTSYTAEVPSSLSTPASINTSKSMSWNSTSPVVEPKAHEQVNQYGTLRLHLDK